MGHYNFWVYMDYAALFAWSFAAATVLPLSSEVPLAYLVRDRGELPWPVAIATAGNVLGACVTYWMARGALRIFRARRAAGDPSPRQRRALDFVRRWGAPALLLSWIPLLGDALVAAAGALRVPFASACPWLVAGKLARYLVVGWAAMQVGARGA